MRISRVVPSVWIVLCEACPSGRGDREVLVMNKECPVCHLRCIPEAKFCHECGARFPAPTEAYDAFVSYRREGGSELAALLQGQLEARYNRRVFLDVDELKSGRFDE